MLLESEQSSSSLGDFIIDGSILVWLFLFILQRSKEAKISMSTNISARIKTRRRRADSLDSDLDQINLLVLREPKEVKFGVWTNMTA